MFLTILSAADVGGVSRLFGRSFRTVHYAVAACGLLAMLIHPLVVATRLGTAAVFVPDVGSWRGLWQNGGRVALYLFVLVAMLPLLRRRVGGAWRTVHLAAYPAFVLAAVHGLMIGRTHHLLGLRIASVAAAVVVGLVAVWRRRAGPRRPPPARWDDRSGQRRVGRVGAWAPLFTVRRFTAVECPQFCPCRSLRNMV